MTIAAIATPPGRGGVGVIRVSGPKVREIAVTLLGALPKPRFAKHASFLDENNEPIDIGLGLFFPAPHSFTGEDVLELQGHGGVVVQDRVLQRLLGLGARLARPGEFCERAFLNGKMDLAQCEAVADLIDAMTTQAASGAMRSLTGDFSQVIHGFKAALVDLRVFVESAIDFPEEEIDFLSDGKVLGKMEEVIQSLQTCLLQSQKGALLREGLQVVIMGQPNVGKSSLLNCLAGFERAIVTEHPGTTRDSIPETIQVEGIPIQVVDTAGLRSSDDLVEQAGMNRTKAQASQADCLLHVQDPTKEALSSEAEAILGRFSGKVISCVNKIDLTGERPGIGANGEVRVSAKTGVGIDALRKALKNVVCVDNLNEGVFVARARHIEALEKALQHCLAGKAQLVNFQAGELLAEELRGAQEALSEILGVFSTEDLLGQIFSTFCIGK